MSYYDAACYCDYDAPTVFRETKVKAAHRKHKCCECGCHIQPSEPYEYVWGIWDGYKDVFKTCERCVELREWARISVPCFCWEYGNIHENVAEMVSEVRHDVPGFFFEYGRRMVAIKKARRHGRSK